MFRKAIELCQQCFEIVGDAITSSSEVLDDCRHGLELSQSLNLFCLAACLSNQVADYFSFVERHVSENRSVHSVYQSELREM